jgi:hypothetical protein
VAAGAAGAGGAPAGTGTPVRVSGPYGAWCWFADPRAVYFHGSTYAGWVDRGGYVVVGSFRGGHAIHKRIAHPAPDGLHDDHDNPGLLVEPDGRITAFYSHHNGGSLFWRRTRHPEDIGSWGKEHTVPTRTAENTYAKPIWLSAEKTAYLFWRGNRQPRFSTRDKHGQWADGRVLLSNPGANPYMKIASNGKDTIGFAFTNDHPRDADVTNIYYARYKRGKIRHTDGRPIRSLDSGPFTPSEADEVYDAHAHQDRHAWIWDVAIAPNGQPVLVFATFSDDQSMHRYEYARWDGSRWRVHPIVESGGTITRVHVERWYSGGVTLDHRDPRIVYGSVQRGDHHEIERFTTGDRGVTWSRKPITSGSPTDNVRPFVPWGLPKGSHQVLWMRGDYNRFENFFTTIVATP